MLLLLFIILFKDVRKQKVRVFFKWRVGVLQVTLNDDRQDTLAYFTLIQQKK